MPKSIMEYFRKPDKGQRNPKRAVKHLYKRRTGRHVYKSPELGGRKDDE